ncbi:MAG: hypothetical protein FWB74_00705 [Defluviitaleaceae bacterium]|nr:hypothetical protein [Defluviitaleaceae bacterium]
MATERELKKIWEEMLFDLDRLELTKDEKKRSLLISSMRLRATTGMTKEEIAEVRQKAVTVVEQEEAASAN